MSWQTEMDDRWKAFRQENIEIVNRLEAELSGFAPRCFNEVNELLDKFAEILPRASLPRKMYHLCNALFDLAMPLVQCASDIKKLYNFDRRVGANQINLSRLQNHQKFLEEAQAYFRRAAASALTTSELLAVWDCADSEDLWPRDSEVWARQLLQRTVELARERSEIEAVMQVWANAKRRLRDSRSSPWSSRRDHNRAEWAAEMIPVVFADRLSRGNL